MTRKYHIIACKEIESNGNWYIKNTRFVIEAKDRTEAEWKVRDKGYTPLSAQRFN